MKNNTMIKDRVYVFLNKELSNPQKTVQVAHLAMESARKFPSENHPSLIVLAIDLSMIEGIKKYLLKKDIQSVEFFEPLFESITGLVTAPLTAAQGKLLQHYPMIKDKDFLPKPSASLWVPTSLNEDELKMFDELMSAEREESIKNILPFSREFTDNMFIDHSSMDIDAYISDYGIEGIKQFIHYCLSQLDKKDYSTIEIKTIIKMLIIQCNQNDHEAIIELMINLIKSTSKEKQRVLLDLITETNLQLNPSQKLIALANIMNVTQTLISGSLLDATTSHLVTIKSDRLDRLYHLIDFAHHWVPKIGRAHV